MRITLKNFRCHIDSTFDIPDHGLVALSGPNGSGKSTIFAAICYALYGKIPGKVKKPYTHGKTTSSVELEYMGLVVVRSAHPKRLLVVYDNIEYEGDPAQSIIIETIGMTHEEFLCAVYVVQRSNTSVLSLTASKQVEFVQTLANSTATKYREEAKERVKSVNQEILGVQGELKALHAQKEEKEALYPEVPKIPVEIKKGLDPDLVRKKIKDLETESLKHQRELEKIRTRLEKARTEQRKRAEAESKIEKLVIEIDQLSKRVESMEMQLKTIRESSSGEEELTETQLETLDQEITEHRSTIEYYRRYLAHLKEKASLDHAIEEYRQTTEAKMTTLAPEVVDDATIEIMAREVEEAEVQKREYDARHAKHLMETTLKEEARQRLAEKFRDIRKLSGIKIPGNVKTSSGMLECLTKNKTERETLLGSLKRSARKQWCCPACSTFVTLSDEGDNLEVVAGQPPVSIPDTDGLMEATQASLTIIEDYIRDVEELAKALNAKIEPLGELPIDPIVLHKALLKAKRIKSEYETLEIGSLPPVIERMKTSVETTSEEFGEEEATSEFAEILILELEGEMHIKIAEKDRVEQLISELSIQRREIASKEKALAKLKSSIPGSTSTITSEELEKQTSDLTRKISDITLEIGAQRKVLDTVADYEHYQNVMLDIAKICEKIAEVDEQNTALERKLEGLYGLEETEKEAEILALEETVNSINEHARVYLDQMFPSDPMIVRLECVKDKGKKGLKLQLNTSIDYKGETYEDIEEFCGGERQRCDIAFLLGVNDMLGGNLLILDECLNELDSSINTEVLSLIRDMCGETKLILVVSHEAVRGLFNTEVIVGQ